MHAHASSLRPPVRDPPPFGNQFTGRWAPTVGAAELIDAALATRRPTAITKRALPPRDPGSGNGGDGGGGGGGGGGSGSSGSSGGGGGESDGNSAGGAAPAAQLPSEWFGGTAEFMRAVVERCEARCDDRSGYWFEHALADAVAGVPEAARADLRGTCLPVVPNPQGSTNLVLSAI